MIGRFLFAATIVGSILTLPWWASVLLMAVYALKFRAFELPAFGALIDYLYGAPGLSILGIPMFFLMCSLTLYVAAELLKIRFRPIDHPGVLGFLR